VLPPPPLHPAASTSARCSFELASQSFLHSYFGPNPPLQVCPLLLRVFPRLGAHHQLEDFARRGEEPKDEVQIYTWMDATLR
jgi:histone deacetylase complex subunit SAP18